MNSTPGWVFLGASGAPCLLIIITYANTALTTSSSTFSCNRSLSLCLAWTLVESKKWNTLCQQVRTCMCKATLTWKGGHMRRRPFQCCGRLHHSLSPSCMNMDGHCHCSQVWKTRSLAFLCWNTFVEFFPDNPSLVGEYLIIIAAFILTRMWAPHVWVSVRSVYEVRGPGTSVGNQWGMVKQKLEAKLVWECFYGTMYHEMVPTLAVEAKWELDLNILWNYGSYTGWRTGSGYLCYSFKYNYNGETMI